MSNTIPSNLLDEIAYLFSNFNERLLNFMNGEATSPHTTHDDVIKWKHFPRYWPFVRGIHRSPVNSPHKGQWRGTLMFSLICTLLNCWVNTREAGDLRRYRDHYDVTVMQMGVIMCICKQDLHIDVVQFYVIS